MNFEVNNKQFYDSLKSVFDVSVKNTTEDFDSAEKITMYIKDSSVNVTAHSGTVAIIQKVSNENTDGLGYKCIEEGLITVQSRNLMSTLESIPPQEKIKIFLNKTDGDFGSLNLTFGQNNRDSQTVPLLKSEVFIPEISKSFQQEIEINKEVFYDSLKKISFAVGDEPTRPKYMYALVDCYEDKADFISGSGARFALNTIEGKTFLNKNKKEKERFIFPKNSIASLLSVLNLSTDENIQIKESVGQKNSPDQIVIKLTDTIIVLLGIDFSVKTQYSDVMSIFKQDHPYKLDVHIDELLFPLKGIRATYNEDCKRTKQIHNVELDFDFNKNVFYFKADFQMKSSRCIGFIEKNNRCKDNISFRANSAYLKEITQMGFSSGDITIRFVSSDKPVAVDYPEIENSQKLIKEKLSLFFTTSKI